MLLSLTACSCQCQTSCGFFTLAKKGLSRDTVAWLNQPIDFSITGIINWLKRKEERALVDHHRLSMCCFAARAMLCAVYALALCLSVCVCHKSVFY